MKPLYEVRFTSLTNRPGRTMIAPGESATLSECAQLPFLLEKLHIIDDHPGRWEVVDLRMEFEGPCFAKSLHGTVQKVMCSPHGGVLPEPRICNVGQTVVLVVKNTSSLPQYFSASLQGEDMSRQIDGKGNVRGFDADGFRKVAP